MRVVRELADLTPGRPTALTIGAFDGIHRGHAYLFDQLKQRAGEASAATLAITFDPDPAEVIAGRPHAYLTSLEEKLALMERAGLDEVCVVHFDRDIANLTAEQFMERIRMHARIVELLVGHDFAMGHDRQGTRDVLATYCQRQSIVFLTSDALEVDGQPVSASRIRACLARGDIEGAARLLGRNPSLRGPVVSGDQRGRELGFPTANVGMSISRALPADGIYVALTHVGGKPWPSAVSVGLRPTFDLIHKTIESYILNFSQDIYGQSVEVEFLHQLRRQEKFDSLAALKEQMAADVAQTRDYFASRPR